LVPKGGFFFAFLNFSSPATFFRSFLSLLLGSPPRMSGVWGLLRKGLATEFFFFFLLHLMLYFPADRLPLPLFWTHRGGLFPPRGGGFSPFFPHNIRCFFPFLSVIVYSLCFPPRTRMRSPWSDEFFSLFVHGPPLPFPVEYPSFAEKSLLKKEPLRNYVTKLCPWEKTFSPPEKRDLFFPFLRKQAHLSPLILPPLSPSPHVFSFSICNLPCLR